MLYEMLDPSELLVTPWQIVLLKNAATSNRALELLREMGNEYGTGKKKEHETYRLHL